MAETTIDDAVDLNLFHPSWDAKAEAQRFIKDEHQFNPEETGDEMPIRIIVETKKGTVHFSYLALDHLPNIIGDYFHRKAKVLKSYLGVSYDSFCMAEKIFKRGISIEQIDKELIVDEQKKEKVKKYSSN